MQTHVKRTVSWRFASLRQLREIHHLVPTATLQMLVVALVYSRLDYANSVLVGLPAYLLRQLQSGLERSRPSSVSSDSSRTHHWCTYLSALVTGSRTDTVQNGCSDIQSPARRLTMLLSSLVHAADVSGRPALRSAGSNRLRIPPFKLSTIGGRAFPVAAAQCWNILLPDNVTSANSLTTFRQQLKHTVFQQSFPDIMWYFRNCNTHSGPSSGIAT